MAARSRLLTHGEVGRADDGLAARSAEGHAAGSADARAPDADADWADEVDAMLASDRIIHSEESITALELSDRPRYQFLLEV